MARSFNGSSDAASVVINLSSFSRLTISMQLWWNAFANTDNLACEYSVNANSNVGGFFVNPNSSSTSAFDIILNANTAVAIHFTRPSAQVWHNYVIELDCTGTTVLTQFPAVYVDGVAQSYSDLSVPAGTVFGNYTLYLMSRAAASLFANGRMADFAIWGGVFLTAGEASALAKGARPKDIRKDNLFLPLDGLQSPEPDFSGNHQNATLTGTALVAGPPIVPFTPRWPRFNGFVGWTPMLPASGLGWIINRRNKLMVPKKRA